EAAAAQRAARVSVPAARLVAARPSSSVNDDHLASGFIGLHHTMGFADLLETEDSRGFRLVAAGRDVSRDALERDVGQREARCAEYEAAEKCQVNTARHLQKQVEISNRRQSPKEAGKAGSTAPSQHVEGVKNGAVSDQVEHRIELLGLGDATGEVPSLALDAR